MSSLALSGCVRRAEVRATIDVTYVSESFSPAKTGPNSSSRSSSHGNRPWWSIARPTKGSRDLGSMRLRRAPLSQLRNGRSFRIRLGATRPAGIIEAALRWVGSEPISTDRDLYRAGLRIIRIAYKRLTDYPIPPGGSPIVFCFAGDLPPSVRGGRKAGRIWISSPSSGQAKRGSRDVRLVAQSRSEVDSNVERHMLGRVLPTGGCLRQPKDSQKDGKSASDAPRRG